MGIKLVLGGKSEEDLLRPWKFIDIVLAFWRFYIDNLWGCVKSGGDIVISLTMCGENVYFHQQNIHQFSVPFFFTSTAKSLRLANF